MSRFARTRLVPSKHGPHYSTMAVLDRLQAALDADTSATELEDWNDDLERLLTAPAAEQIEGLAPKSSAEDTAQAIEHGRRLSRRLAELLLESLGSRDENGESIRERASVLVLQCKGQDNPLTCSDKVARILRTCKNWLRWYLQIFQATHEDTSDPISDFKATPMLELYLFLMEQTIVQQEETARCASQVFFYSTYNAVTGSDEHLQQSFAQLAEDGLFETFLRFLVQSRAPTLILSLVRNVHNVVVSYAKGAESVKATAIDVTSPLSPWAHEGSMDYVTALRGIVVWALAAEPQFPGTHDDVRAELVVEILRTFYALRTGLLLTADEGLSAMVIGLLRLDDTEDVRLYECQIASVSLLMDAETEFGDHLLQQDALPCLLRILERQASKVIDSNRIDNSAAASLTPILVVMHKYCTANEAFRHQTRDSVFPLEEESRYQKLVLIEEANRGPVAKNMSPLDAPPDTLRGRLCRLLTWPQGHIKRFTGELLWILCEGNRNEFVHRVGMGNAVPILNLKGFVSLPTELQS